ncbi:hypothetical protein PoB_005532000 [Plakobranchus ocellatus]|uniref:Uncharacterized protein n=1 Tax=Plakobranchus ocellatus TaxID=259542 RepID=A0AAV4CBM5_9GAST|nr:hypothetical protein PoB_005532000 [Plakobranchus ocellatus]
MVKEEEEDEGQEEEEKNGRGGFVVMDEKEEEEKEGQYEEEKEEMEKDELSVLLQTKKIYRIFAFISRNALHYVIVIHMNNGLSDSWL